MKCNICGYPDFIEYKEIDETTGSVKIKKHKVKCLGHDVHPSLWNGSDKLKSRPNYTDYQKLRIKQNNAS